MAKNKIKRVIKCFSVLFFASLISAQTACSQGNMRGRGPQGPDMRRIDTNNDRKVSLKEWQNFHKKMFAKMDSDGNGYLTSAETGSGQESGAAENDNSRRGGRGDNGNDRSPRLPFDNIDSNGDRKISYKEWTSHHRGMFEEMDRNGDGYLSEDDGGPRR